MKYLILIFTIFLSLPIFAQYDIDIKLQNYDNDTLIIGHYYADKQLVKDTLITKKKGAFELSGLDTLDPGVYFLLTIPNKEYIQFFVNGIDNEFEIKWDVKEPTNYKFKGSKDNELFTSYLDLLAEQRPLADDFRARITAADSTGTKDDKAAKGLEEIDNIVTKRQLEIIGQWPEFITSKFINSSVQLKIPEFEGEDKQLKTYHYYKTHYFDNIDLGDPANLRTPYIHNRITYYLEKLTPQDPDSTIISVDYMLGLMEPAPDTYRYYLSYFLNEYAKMKLVGFDKIYVHLVDNYYSKGKADWISEENLQKMIDQANNLRPILIGEKFPDITTFKQDSSPVRIWDVESPYTIVMFWAHDCGHCTKSMPDVVSFYDEFQSQGVTLISICTKGGEKMTPCQEAIPKKKMEKFINTYDEYQRFRRKVYIPSTPKIFILDKDKNILIKDIPAKELKNIMPEIMKIDAQQR